MKKSSFKWLGVGICSVALLCGATACGSTLPPAGEATDYEVTQAEWEQALSHETFKNVTISCVGEGGEVTGLCVVRIADNKVEADMQVATNNMHYFYEYSENGVTHYLKNETGNWQKGSMQGLSWENLMATGTSGAIPFYSQLAEHYQKFTCSEGVYTTQDSVTFTVVIGGENTSFTLQDIAVKFLNGKAIEISYTMMSRATVTSTYTMSMSDYGTTEVTLPAVTE